ncbi:hypothetical protein [Leptolyngbya ohadii]|uniref:hypothetical protein n=1 Tax=Leptolyngbya ohadii TaxID=1962290 RepID=UPI0015C642B4|nr:hypothetical protein [Leptolyngbya ohadii]
MAQRERLSIDVSDIKEVVENCRDDIAWQEMPLSTKIRVLVKERLEQIRAEKEK